MPVDRLPVLLVPGAFGQDIAYWNLLARYLRKRGHPVRTVSFPAFTMSDLRASARMLHEAAQDTRDKEGADRVHLVGHSMGGLISRYYLQVLDGREGVASLACLATPHRGTWAGITAPIFKGCRQILPGSAFLSKLDKTAERLAGMPVLNVWSRADVVVVPGRNALLDAPGADNRCAAFAGHWAMLASPFVFRWVGEHVAAAQAAHAREPGALTRAGARPRPARAGSGEAAPG